MAVMPNGVQAVHPSTESIGVAKGGKWAMTSQDF